MPLTCLPRLGRVEGTSGRALSCLCLPAAMPVLAYMFLGRRDRRALLEEELTLGPPALPGLWDSHELTEWEDRCPGYSATRLPGRVGGGQRCSRLHSWGNGEWEAVTGVLGRNRENKHSHFAWEEEEPGRSHFCTFSSSLWEILGVWRPPLPGEYISVY